MPEFLLYVNDRRPGPHFCDKNPCRPTAYPKPKGKLCPGSELALSYIKPRLRDSFTITNITKDLTQEQRNQLKSSGIDGSPALVVVKTGEILFGNEAVQFISKLEEPPQSFQGTEDDELLDYTKQTPLSDIKLGVKEKKGKVNMKLIEARLKQLEAENKAANSTTVVGKD